MIDSFFGRNVDSGRDLSPNLGLFWYRPGPFGPPIFEPAGTPVLGPSRGGFSDPLDPDFSQRGREIFRGETPMVSGEKVSQFRRHVLVSSKGKIGATTPQKKTPKLRTECCMPPTSPFFEPFSGQFDPRSQNRGPRGKIGVRRPFFADDRGFLVTVNEKDVTELGRQQYKTRIFLLQWVLERYFCGLVG